MANSHDTNPDDVYTDPAPANLSRTLAEGAAALLHEMGKVDTCLHCEAIQEGIFAWDGLLYTCISCGASEEAAGANYLLLKMARVWGTK